MFGKKGGMSVRILLIASVAAFLLPMLKAQIVQSVKIDPPGCTSATVFAMSGNKVVGTCFATDGTTHAYYFDGTSSSMIEFPTGTTFKTFVAMSSGSVIGDVYARNGKRAFLYDGSGAAVLIDPPGSRNSDPVAANGNNVIGTSDDQTGHRHAFLYSNGAAVIIDPPNSLSASAVAIDKNNTILGNSNDKSGTAHVFLSNGRGATTFIDPPGGNNPFAMGLSNGNAIGTFIYKTRFQGFLYNGSSSALIKNPFGYIHNTPVAVSGGNVAGNISDTSEHQHAFFYNGKDPVAIIDPDGSATSTVLAIDGNNVIGNFTDAQKSNDHAFVYQAGASSKILETAGKSGSGPVVYSCVVAVSGNDVIGNCRDTSNHAFFYNGSGDPILIDPPDKCAQAYAVAISGNNVIGYCTDSTGNSHAFAYIAGGSSVIIDPKDSVAAKAILVSGNYVAGTFGTAGYTGAGHAFLATIPEPAK